MSYPRLRTSADEPTFLDWNYVDFNGVPGTKGPKPQTWSTRTMTDVVDENFHARVRDGEVFNNACELTVKSFEASANQGTYSWWLTSDPSQVYTKTDGHVTSWLLTRNIWSNYDVVTCSEPSFDWTSQAKSFALANVDSTPYEFFEDLAEVRETLQFLRHPLHSLAELAKAYARRKRGYKRRGDFKKAANLWKQYRFAAAPLVRSIMNAMEVLQNFSGLERPARRSAHGFSEISEKLDHEYFEPFSGGGPEHFIVKYDKVSSISIEGHAAIYYEVSNPLVDWKFALGLRLKDLPVTFWEVLPLSFMFDRLWHVKNMATGLFNLADPTVSILAASVTSKRLERVNITALSQWWSYSTYTSQNDELDSVNFDTFKYKRDVWVPEVGDIVPPLTPAGLVDDITKILDLVAIIATRLK